MILSINISAKFVNFKIVKCLSVYLGELLKSCVKKIFSKNILILLFE